MKTILMLYTAALLLTTTPHVVNVSNTQTTANETCTIDDQSQDNLGYGRVTYSSGYVDVPMPTSGTYTPTVSGFATSITIFGQSVNAPGTGLVALPNGDTVSVHWTDINAITIVNVTEN